MNFKETVKKNFDEWQNRGFCQDAVELNNNVGKGYFDVANPHFFTGDIAAKLAFVHLNPKRNQKDWNSKCNYVDFEDYWAKYAQFGANTYGINSKRTHKSPFDLKQIRFLKPFGILPFNDDKYHDLEIVIDKKLQLELVPFGSPNFNYLEIDVKNLNPFVTRLLNLLMENKRDYVFFCGRVFLEILKKYIVKEKRHSFYLTKNDGSLTKSIFEAINIKLQLNNSEITACILPQYAKQGYPVSEYGKEVFNRYGQF
ncbi:MAG: hypothetical protein LBN95_03710 [Prevotellaceae bacterium]|jgi:hypothetical protein|nr:hypothetical protein [Prevotellaceae bacterium]